MRRELLALGGASATILELDINDITSSRTAVQMLADRATIRGLLTDIGTYDTTLTPTTSSSDAWKTAANRSVAGSSSTQRIAFNGALRGGMMAGSAGTIDVASFLETSIASENGPVQHGGVWIPRT